MSAKLTLPMFLYNIPSRTGPVPMATLRHAMDIPGCIGFKDSSASMLYLHEAVLMRDEVRPEFKVLVGPEELLAESVLFGVDGGVAGGANLFPELILALYRAAKAREIDTMLDLQRTLMTVSTTLYRSGQHPSSFIKSVKRGLEVQGVCGGTMTRPYEPFKSSDLPRVDGVFKKAQDLIAKQLDQVAAGRS